MHISSHLQQDTASYSHCEKKINFFREKMVGKKLNKLKICI